MALVLLTNVTDYAGPGALNALLADGHDVLCHDASFGDVASRRAFALHRDGAIALAAQGVEEIYGEVLAGHAVPDAIVLNDVHANEPRAIELTAAEEWQATFDAVVRTPIRLTQRFLPAMKERRGGAFVFVTSARGARPEVGFSVATTLRAATTAFAKAVAVEGAPFGIQSNVVAPNYLYSELYYPRAKFVDDPDGRESIARSVPFGRLGRQDEVGALVAFLASGRSAFTTGQVVHFTGGWS